MHVLLRLHNLFPIKTLHPLILTAAILPGKPNLGGGCFKQTNFAFFGGQGTIAAGGTNFQGTFHQTSKVYP